MTVVIGHGHSHDPRRGPKIAFKRRKGAVEIAVHCGYLIAC